jgi:hypothetical protein
MFTTRERSNTATACCRQQYLRCHGKMSQIIDHINLQHLDTMHINHIAPCTSIILRYDTYQVKCIFTPSETVCRNMLLLPTYSSTRLSQCIHSVHSTSSATAAAAAAVIAAAAVVRSWLQQQGSVYAQL